MSASTTSRATIIAADENNHSALIDGIKYLFNGSSATILNSGGVWIDRQQSGRSGWLNDGDLAVLADAIRNGTI